MLQSNRLIRAVAACATAGLVLGSGLAPARAAPPPPEQDQAAAAIDPAAVAALTHMGEYLATLKSFELTAATTIEVELRGGTQVEIGGLSHYWVKRPNQLRIDSETDATRRQYFFDGKTFTIVAPLQGYFAQVEGKATIRETLAFAAQNLNVEVPLADLFDWSTPQTPLEQFQRGFFVGTAKINGVMTEHYALMGKDLGLEIWIQQGDVPLPVKMALVDHRTKGDPRFTAVLDWKPDATIDEALFTFTPPKDVAKITFAQPAADQKGAQ